MAHKKAGGSSRNGRDSAGRRLGVKFLADKQLLLGTLLFVKEELNGNPVKMLVLEGIIQFFH